MKNNMYKNILSFINELKIDYKLSDYITYSKESNYDTYVFKNKENGNIDFYLSLSTSNNPRIELQIANPFSEIQTDYLIIGEFYDLTMDEQYVEVKNIIKAFLSNKVEIVNYILNNKSIKTKYSYGYYLNNRVQILIELFNKKQFILPWKKKDIIKETFKFEPWINSELTIRETISY